MPSIFNRDEIPSHLFAIKELDLAKYCLVEKLPRPWFCLGEVSKSDKNGINARLQRETMLTAIGAFKNSASSFDAVGAVIRNLGMPTAWSSTVKGLPKYRYLPFHSFETAFRDFSGEPVVFIRTLNGDLVINPDLWLFLELTEKRDPDHVWYDGEKHVDVIQILKDADSERVLIRADYLLKYLQSRQQELLVSEFRQIIFTPGSSHVIDDFPQGTLRLINSQGDSKAIMESYGPKRDFGVPYYVRRTHLWSTIEPPAINEEDPFNEIPDFDLAAFVLPTSSGLVAPARFLPSQFIKHKFSGTTCDFADRVFFSQEALVRYQTLPNHEISDDGAVRHSTFWSFDRSVIRFGDDYLSIAIGDFAEGVAFHEWQHWAKFAVDPPDDAWFDPEKDKQSIRGQVNRLISELYSLSEAFEYFCQKFVPDSAGQSIWNGDDKDQIVKELKWFYPTHESDADFRTRVAQLSVLVVDGLHPTLMRTVLVRLNALLPEDKFTGGLKLLQRLCLAVNLMSAFQTQHDLQDLLKLTIQKPRTADESELAAEAQFIANKVREIFAPLVGLYDLRTGSGLAHPPSKDKISDATKLLGLPTKGWTRAHYLLLLGKVSTCISQISEILSAGARWEPYEH